MAQASSEATKVLVDDVIQALKVNDTEKAQVHLSILNQQLPTFVNSTSLQSVKVLLDDVSSAIWKSGSRDIRDVLKIAKLCNPKDTEEDITRLISIHQKYHKTGNDYN
jgi:hypothetical protein